MTEISDLIPFGGTGLDRAAHLRCPAAAGKLWRQAGSKSLPLWRSQLLMNGDTLAWQDCTGEMPDDAILICQTTEGAIFTRDIGGEAPPKPLLPADLRAVLPQIAAQDSAIIATALGCAHWHNTHRFCGRCGAPTQMGDLGWRRSCTGCDAQLFPRTDPVVIMLITHGEDALLARAPAWPERMYSVLAGFMEPGETIEAAVRRETHEEVGLACHAIRYLGSQPWPFPGSLMIGCHAEADRRDFTPDPAEIADAHWVSRQDLMRIFADDHALIRPPRLEAIAGQMLKKWVAGGLD